MANSSLPKIGFIGLGIMGKPMAINLVKAGYQLTVYDQYPAPVEELVKQGALSADSSSAVAATSDIIITMLPNSPDVEVVVLGKKGVLEGIKAGAIIIDMSSIEPLVSQKIAKIASEKRVEFLDAPVSGGEPGAIQGALAIMVGGKQAIFDKCLDIFNVMGKSAVLVGDIGAGGFAKLANQIIVALNIAAVSEAFVLGQKAGLDPEKLFQAIRGGLAGSNVMDAKAPLMMDRKFDPGFKIKLHDKDIKNALSTAGDLQLPLPLTGLIQQMITTLLVDGHGESDHSAIVHFVENLAKTKVNRK
jgi:2-hydroxy-3-oxopropionate reductase